MPSSSSSLEKVEGSDENMKYLKHLKKVYQFTSVKFYISLYLKKLIYPAFDTNYSF